MLKTQGRENEFVTRECTLFVSKWILKFIHCTCRNFWLHYDLQKRRNSVFFYRKLNAELEAKTANLVAEAEEVLVCTIVRDVSD